MRKRFALLLFLAVTLCQAGISQDAIFLTNPSFEDFARHSIQPKGWIDCGFPGESPPDTQPSGDFGVTFPPTDGNTYLGMVVRDNETWESVSQRLSKPLLAGNCYEFSLHLARSRFYVSISRIKGDEVNFSRPVKVRIYGGSRSCSKDELLDETGMVTQASWMQYNFKFEPRSNYDYIIIEAFYETPVLFPYNGNVLIDNASAIEPIPCDEPVSKQPEPIQLENEQPDIAETAPTPAPTPPPSTPSTSEPEPQPQSQPSPSPAEEEVTIAGVKRSEMEKGKRITLDKLYFEADSAQITKKSFEALDELVNFMKVNKDVAIEIGGHTNSLPPQEYCLKLSTARAKAVADYLAQKGINRER
ncbi:MAG TPA: OmpA family protein, partial [Phaeodactylibacter sp.]|nr:OmpA family protein [Phaeodactylibacter sp.]